MLAFDTNLILVEFHVRCLTFFLLFSVKDSFQWKEYSQEYPVLDRV